MNVSAYLNRIGYHGPLQPSSEVLRKLHRCHLLSVPFENLDIHLDRAIILSEAAFYDKIVEHHRGGFCYELNGSFAALLRSLGFRVSMLSARPPREAGGLFPEFEHMALLVRLNERWLADVGFGDSVIEPKRLDEAGPQRDNGRAYRITRNGARRLLSEWDAKNHLWKAEYVFTLRPRKLEDFVPRCHYQETSPDSHFKRSRICSRPTSKGRVTLSDKKFIVTEGGRRHERLLRNQEEFTSLLRKHFGISLS